MYEKAKYCKFVSKANMSYVKKYRKGKHSALFIWDIKRDASTPMHQCTIESASMQQQHQYAAAIVHQQHQCSSNIGLAAAPV